MLIEYAALLSSLAWERNFSVVKSGFLSSKIRFQKLENFASVKKTKAVLTVFKNSLYKSDKAEVPASPVSVSSSASRLKKTEAVMPTASKACWEFCTTALSSVCRSKGMKSEAWPRVSPESSKCHVNELHIPHEVKLPQGEAKKVKNR